jgi:hypothetical protein
MRHTLIILTTLFIFCSCSTKNKQSSNSFKVILPDTNKTHQVYTTFEHLKLLGDQMDLGKIYNGVDSFEIRLWIVSMLNPNRMVQLKKSNQLITSQEFTYDYSPDNKLSIRAGKIIQNNSYQILVDSLKFYGFESLLSQEEIDNFVDNIADGVTYTMEIATSKYYKLISYHCPEHYAKTEENNRHFLNIVLLLDNYLHFYSPICSP